MIGTLRFSPEMYPFRLRLFFVCVVPLSIAIDIAGIIAYNYGVAHMK